MSKALIWLGLLIGSILGGYVPSLFGAELFSLWGLLGSTLGAVAGIFVGYKLGEHLGV